MYPDNNWYGHRAVLNKYCEQPDREIFGTIQHGWVSKEEASEINMTRKQFSSLFSMEFKYKFNI